MQNEPNQVEFYTIKDAPHLVGVRVLRTCGHTTEDAYEGIVIAMSKSRMLLNSSCWACASEKLKLERLSDEFNKVIDKSMAEVENERFLDAAIEYAGIEVGAVEQVNETIGDTQELEESLNFAFADVEDTPLTELEKIVLYGDGTEQNIQGIVVVGNPSVEFDKIQIVDRLNLEMQANRVANATLNKTFIEMEKREETARRVLDAKVEGKKKLSKRQRKKAASKGK